MTGRDDVTLGWNVEPPVFFDDFESYSPFALTFGDWTGIDGDEETTAPLMGTYPNRGGRQYCQIMNPLTVEPTWWYEYPVLRPYSGQQYAGFIRTSSGRVNDDWLISPVIESRNGYELKFLAKAYSSMYAENLDIYVAEESAPDDFSLLVQVEDLPSEGWGEYTVPIGEFEGKKIRVGFNYVSVDAFLMQLDSFRLQPADGAAPAKSYGNIDHFEISVDGKTEHTCTEPSFTLRIPE